MIDSIYARIDAYKRQGRINAQAAFSALNISSESVAKRTALTPLTEFKLDVLSNLNSYVGWLFDERQKPVTEDDISLIMQLSIAKVADYWESRGQSVLYNDYTLIAFLREYLALCFTTHHLSLDAYNKFSTYAQAIMDTGKINPFASYNMLDLSVIFMLPKCINGIRQQDVEEFILAFTDSYLSLEEYLHYPNHNMHFDPYIAAENNNISAAVSFIDEKSGRYVFTGVNNDLLLNYPGRPFRRWCDDILDLTLCCEDIVYSIMCNGVVYFFGKNGRPLSLDRISMKDLWFTYLQCLDMSKDIQPLRYGNGLTIEGYISNDLYGKYCAIQDITEDIYRKISWHGGNLEEWDICLYSALTTVK